MRLTQERELIRPKVRIVAINVGVAAEMALFRRVQRNQVGAECRFICRAVGPERAAGGPERSQTVVMCYGVLDDKTVQSLRVRNGYPEADRPP